MVLVDHAAEDFPALHRRGKRHGDWLVVIVWPLLPGLVRPMPVIVPGVGPKGRPQMAFAVDRPSDGGVELFDPARVSARRYYYRGTKITAPWPSTA